VRIATSLIEMAIRTTSFLGSADSLSAYINSIRTTCFLISRSFSAAQQFVYYQNFKSIFVNNKLIFYVIGNKRVEKWNKVQIETRFRVLFNMETRYKRVLHVPQVSCSYEEYFFMSLKKNEFTLTN